MAQVTVSGTLKKPDGTAIVGAAVKATLTTTDFQISTSDGILGGSAVETTTDGTGAWSLSLWANTDGVVDSRYTVSFTPVGKSPHTFVVDVPPSGPVTFAALVSAGLSTTAQTNQIILLIDETETAITNANAATASANTATTNANAATTSANAAASAANAAKTAADSAAAAANTAAANADTARAATETATSNANASTTAANNAAAAANTAKTNADTATTNTNAAISSANAATTAANSAAVNALAATIPFTLSVGGLVALETHGPDYSSRAAVLKVAQGKLKTNSTSGSVVVEVRKNGSGTAAVTFTITTGGVLSVVWVDTAEGGRLVLADGDYIEWVVTAAGTGAYGLMLALDTLVA